MRSTMPQLLLVLGLAAAVPACAGDKADRGREGGYAQGQVSTEEQEQYLAGAHDRLDRHDAHMGQLNQQQPQQWRSEQDRQAWQRNMAEAAARRQQVLELCSSTRQRQYSNWEERKAAIDQNLNEMQNYISQCEELRRSGGYR